MNLRTDLSLTVADLVASSLPGSLLQSLDDELGSILASRPVNLEHISRLVHRYRSGALPSPDSQSRWQKLENLLRLVATSPNQEEASAYLRLTRNMIMTESTQQQPLSPPTKASEPLLSTYLLENHDNMMTPLRDLNNSPSYAESFENIDRYSDRRSVLSSNYGRKYRDRTDTATLSSLSDPYFSNVANEEDMLKSIPFTLLATTSHMFVFDDSGVHIPGNVLNGESGMLHILFEAGLLYRFLDKQIRTHRNSDTLSPLKIALLTFVDQKLHDYMVDVNSISNKADIRSLKALYIEIEKWVIEFRIYYNLLIEIQQLRGDRLLSRVYDLRNHGNLLVKAVAESLYSSLAFLYYEYLANWLTGGQLDSHQEFFVEPIQNSDPNQTFLKLDTDRVPTFIPERTAEEIFMIGKTHLFLEKECLEIQWINSCNRKYTQIYKNLKMSGISTSFCDTVTAHYGEIMTFCRKTLDAKYSFSDVLRMLKDVLLMGKGDFMERMICNSSEFLQEPSATLPSYKLTRCLQESIKQSSLKFMLTAPRTAKLVDGIDARVLELGHGSIGWDVFTLDYLASKPLLTVFEFSRGGGRKEYLRMFNFLWKIKKNNHFFQEQWSRNNTLVRDFRRLRRGKPFIRDVMGKILKVNVLKANIQHLNRKIESFCLLSIVERNYASLQTKIKNDKSNSKNTLKTTCIKNGIKVAEGILKPHSSLVQQIGLSTSINSRTATYTIDDLRRIHDDYLQKIVTHKLLDSGSQNRTRGAYSKQYYPASLIILLGDLFEFTLQYSEFNDIIHDLLLRLSLHSTDEVSKLLTRLNQLLIKIVAHYKWIQKTSYYLIKDLKADGDTELLSLSKVLR
ncbi:LAME_0H05644g1_1 [Lachancea meyersii CBS 8951]|uniref:Spindle pole body component n=1 Tax=Lachancea meyersii CBS 8951 TaxID=1266667 RepID=A0A1G4KEE4_9SACH|nr:LAME_0H05644g1_1 [Lachancea meyersii CBS 8951]